MSISDVTLTGPGAESATVGILISTQEGGLAEEKADLRRITVEHFGTGMSVNAGSAILYSSAFQENGWALSGGHATSSLVVVATTFEHNGLGVTQNQGGGWVFLGARFAANGAADVLPHRCLGCARYILSTYGKGFWKPSNSAQQIPHNVLADNASDRRTDIGITKRPIPATPATRLSAVAPQGEFEVVPGPDTAVGIAAQINSIFGRDPCAVVKVLPGVHRFGKTIVKPACAQLEGLGNTVLIFRGAGTAIEVLPSRPQSIGTITDLTLESNTGAAVGLRLNADQDVQRARITGFAIGIEATGGRIAFWDCSSDRNGSGLVEDGPAAPEGPGCIDDSRGACRPTVQRLEANVTAFDTSLDGNTGPGAEVLSGYLSGYSLDLTGNSADDGPQMEVGSATAQCFGCALSAARGPLAQIGVNAGGGSVELIGGSLALTAAGPGEQDFIAIDGQFSSVTVEGASIISAHPVAALVTPELPTGSTVNASLNTGPWAGNDVAGPVGALLHCKDIESPDGSCIEDAIANLPGGSGEVDLPPADYLIRRNITVPSGVVLSFAPGAVLDVRPPAVVTINGTIRAGNYQIFRTLPPRHLSDIRIDAGSNVLHSETPAFDAADVGARIRVDAAGAPAPWGVPEPAIGQVTSVQSPTAATVSFSSATSLTGTPVLVGGSSVAFGNGAVSEINPVWWGADPSGKSDSTAALQAAIATGADANIPVLIPAGIFLTGQLDGGDPFLKGEFSADQGSTPGAADIHGAGSEVQGGGGDAGETVLRYDGSPSQGFVLARNNMQGISWGGFAVDGAGNAPCINASWLIVGNSGGPSAQDTFSGITAENCVGTGIDLDNDNDSTISDIRVISVEDLDVVATGTVDSGSMTPLALASVWDIRGDDTVRLSSGSGTALIAIAKVEGNSIVPASPWPSSYSPGTQVVVPAVGLSLIAGTGEQSLSDVRLAQGLLAFDVQNGSVNGGFLADGIELGFGSWDFVNVNGTQIWPNHVLGAAFFGSGTTAAPPSGFSCSGCFIAVAAGQSAIAGIWEVGGTMQMSFLLLNTDASVFGAITPTAQQFPLFTFEACEITNGVPSPASNVRWQVCNSVEAAGAGGSLFSGCISGP